LSYKHHIVLITSMFFTSQNGAPSNHLQGGNIWTTIGFAITVFVAVTGYSC